MKNYILGIAIGISYVLSGVILFKISGLENKLESMETLSHQISSVDTNIQSVSSEVQTKVDDYLQEQKWISQKDYEVKKLDLTNQTVDVALKWSLRDLLDEEKVSFLYREEETQNWTELKVIETGGLNYSLQHTFPLDGNYETQLIATGKNGKRSEPLLSLRFNEMLTNRITIEAYLNPGDEDQYDISIHVNNPLENETLPIQDYNDLKIKRAQAVLYVRDHVWKKWDLLKQHNDFNESEFVESLDFTDTVQMDKIQNDEKVELHVIVEDFLGLQYKTKALVN
ncbi:hypothetical protein M3182_02275 [Mesobacillus maritimus]|uniref:hypothetical protein n=1 Tax=Mesobacillus maritimus TaxID=1643336 RepID=UPI00203D973F|nr:hypothetical protein [Mesobacillus maritimus]MCM3584568.1 hypothetical protein [Mesobacillus maritimus]MCM3670643.1 hypothetical protein [Mesobacillus maritimus]